MQYIYILPSNNSADDSATWRPVAEFSINKTRQKTATQVAEKREPYGYVDLNVINCNLVNQALARAYNPHTFFVHSFLRTAHTIPALHLSHLAEQKHHCPLASTLMADKQKRRKCATLSWNTLARTITTLGPPSSILNMFHLAVEACGEFSPEAVEIRESIRKAVEPELYDKMTKSVAIKGWTADDETTASRAFDIYSEQFIPVLRSLMPISWRFSYWWRRENAAVIAVGSAIFGTAALPTAARNARHWIEMLKNARPTSPNKKDAPPADPRSPSDNSPKK